jgi:peptide/nickel transport system permease protein/nickel transport system permease protein
MGQYIARRLFHLCIVLAGISVICFLLLAFSGKDPAEYIARRADINASGQQIDAIRSEMGLDQPLVERYFEWIVNLIRGKPGNSLYSGRPIATDFAQYFPVTFSLVALAMLWVVILGIPIGLLSARFRDSVADHAIRGVTLLGMCIPTFWQGFLLLLAFAIRIPLYTVMPQPGIRGYVLPSLALGLPIVCSLIRLYRSALLSQLSADYVQYAKARGLSAWRILVRHVMRNALPPIITLFCQYLGYLIAGSAVVESVFSLNGIGTYLISCVLASDSVSVASCMLVIATVFVVSNLLGDVANGLLCPWMVRESNG